MRMGQLGTQWLLTGLLALAPVAGVSAASDGAAQADEAAVLQVEAVRLEAMREGDIATLDRITGADYVHIESTGQRRNKAEFLDGFRNREYRFKSFVIEANHVRMLGNVAVVTGRYSNIIETPEGVQPVKHARHMRVYALREGRWINIAHQATAIADDTP
ncbi:nuclear transport factor 2 family protein [Altericroceibacterium spongiae]|uniref:Nuclear transport factor 2 family protein n=1 Tax=Altericroceibacterium spongiae TaxID=2320269 RepID=A0A420EMH5_9SPHN|nr:nuclear transport factor 2 family protein [Altericroceibacterium spongiae]RKF21860.1 nuclear transport factor 2 family protein [Altericroceibacterium spongiae]